MQTILEKYFKEELVDLGQLLFSTSSFVNQLEVAFPTLYYRDLMQKIELCKRL